MLLNSLLMALLSITIIASFDDPSKIDSSRVLISTVLDISSEEIIRDVFTLLRSYRLFGESLNNSTFLVCLCASSDSVIGDELKLYNELDQLNVEISFIKQTPSPFPKTLNKFEAFKKFDKFRFDYFLWLDADVFIFSDPLKILKSHSYPGEIKCVPDFYNYMVRYPTIIKSSIFWNPKLSTFKLIGAGEDAPHGLCNTGILFFDYLSLQNFMEQLPQSIKDIDSINIFKVDRFLDSLYFVGTVNQRNIQVSILGFEFNYMAMFEVEIIHDTTTPDIIFGHFLSNTSLFCYIQTPSDICTCLYHNKHIPSDSLIVRKVNNIINNNNCSKLVPLPGTSTSVITNNTIRKQTDIVSNLENNNHCQSSNSNSNSVHSWIINWPLPQSLLQYTDNIIEFNLEMTVIENKECSNTNTKLSDQVDGDSQGKSSEVDSTGNSNRESMVDQLVNIKVVDNTLDDVLFNTSTTLSASTLLLEEQLLMILNVRFYIEPRHRLPLTNITVILTWYEGYPLAEILSQSIIMQVHCLTLLPPGYTSYSFNPLMGLKPLVLESQVQWANYLNIHQISGIGIAICCDTYKGIKVIKNLIEQWSGDFLLILIVSVPVVVSSVGNISTVYSLDQLQSELKVTCNNRPFSGGGVSCIFTQETTTIMSKLMYPKDIYFIYMDYYVNYFQYLRDLEHWQSKLSFSGILAGSRYVHTYGRMDLITTIATTTTTTTKKMIVPGIRIRPAVDLFASTMRYMVLATFYESKEGGTSSSSDDISAMIEKNAPCWYIFKLK